MSLLLKRLLVLSVCLFALGGCGSLLSEWAAKLSTTPPRGPVASLPPHESWCYKTLGRIDCYPEPQDFPPESLVSVDPPSRFPLTREDHAKALAKAQKIGE